MRAFVDALVGSHDSVDGRGLYDRAPLAPGHPGPYLARDEKHGIEVYRHDRSPRDQIVLSHRRKESFQIGAFRRGIVVEDINGPQPGFNALDRRRHSVRVSDIASMPDGTHAESLVHLLCLCIDRRLIEIEDGDRGTMLR